MQNNRRTVFVADDDEDILQMIVLILESDGYNVISTNNANHIFDIEGSLPDLILLDIWMSGIDGREICKRLKTNVATSKIPVLLVSANTNISEIAMECPADGFIEKPFDMYDFLNKIKGIFLKSE